MAAAPALQAAWTATDGFNSSSFIEFNEESYAAMRDDERRTPLFEKALQQRIGAAPPDSLTVLDIGTGPFALLALAAYKAGAKKVYTIEANKEAARRARDVLRRANIPTSKIEVVEGFSTTITLPEKVDLLVAGAGSVMSEGVYATIRDAQARLLKRPSDPLSYIPAYIETLAAPASYALHYALGPPEFDWTKLKEPIRLNCRDESLELLADPLVLERINFYDTALPSSGVLPPQQQLQPLSWSVDAQRLDANEQLFYEELKKEGAKKEEHLSRRPSRAASRACDVSLVLDPEGTLVVESRGPRRVAKVALADGAAADGEPAGDYEAKQTIRVAFEVDLRDGKPNTPLNTALLARLRRAGGRTCESAVWIGCSVGPAFQKTLSEREQTATAILDSRNLRVRVRPIRRLWARALYELLQLTTAIGPSLSASSAATSRIRQGGWRARERIGRLGRLGGRVQ